MRTDDRLTALRDLVQQDVGGRGLAADPRENLLTVCAGDFAAACHSLAATPNPVVGIVTGFFIPHAEPPCSETDGPLGALFLARALAPLGVRLHVRTDAFCRRALEAGLQACGLADDCQVEALDPPEAPAAWTHLIALEQAGPSHTAESVQAQGDAAALERFRREVPAEEWDRYHTMRGRDVTPFMAPAHRLFEAVRGQPVATIGIGDGGNEIGMGKVPWEVIHRNIPGGGPIACRVPTDHLIVAGVSNWGAYALAAGVRLLRGASLDPDLFDPRREEEMLRLLVEHGPLVDGVTGRHEATVDGLSFEVYGEVLRRLERVLEAAAS